MVTGSNDTIVCVWNLDTKGRVYKFLGHRVSPPLNIGRHQRRQVLSQRRPDSISFQGLDSQAVEQYS